ncbi:shikimate 5-dehydrogenase [Adhaeribacter aerolatus]|uniref:Shikimate 5-dehydrogenase n=1 Tax=Adhaeribacter aerolatus TaxID=670289 RepID=A0A512AYT9_9BACT|nr:shikimate dehydrogenase [Adhaeribacter aerolatus]GEO04885.1 shikimate 5-dehydrogenase [Adhaeribacter aerolatus]
MKAYGLIGYPLTHSFSEKYFAEKFKAENITDCVYKLYELPDIQAFPALIKSIPNLHGLNVTVPHKEKVIPYLDAVETQAKKIGAVNVIKFQNGKTTGYNSDYQGFMQSLENFYSVKANSKALIFGTGGAAKAVLAALDSLGISYKIVSRQPQPSQLHYNELHPDLMAEYSLLINTTPLGTYPKVDTCPPIPYEALSENHYLYDLVYNPAETLFLQKGRAAGAKIKNGHEMLVRQAEVAWVIWNS